MEAMQSKRQSWLIGGMAALAAALYATYGLLRHWRFASSGFDLGIFDQLLWQYHRFAVPANTVRDIPNLLGDHFHPLLVMLTPFYWIYPHAETLIVLQAALVASSAIPLWLYAKEKLGLWPAYGMAAAYLSFWGLLHGVAYDFHDYKAAGVTAETLKGWAAKVGWEVLLNRSGTTFRKLPDADKTGLTQAKAIELMVAQPSMIKRPVLEVDEDLLVGFKADQYEAKFD